MSDFATDTAIHLHLELGGKDGALAAIPCLVQYPMGRDERTSHHPCRAGVFDVSHHGARDG